MHKRFSILVGVLFGSLVLQQATARAELASAEEEGKATAARDEEMLRKAGLSTETKDLIEWLKQRSEDDADLGKIDELIKQLTFTDKEEREKAKHKLAMLGLNGWIQLIKAAKSDEYPLGTTAKACMEEIAKEHEAFLNLATVRLLVHRKAAGAVQALLRYLPFTVDETVEEAIYYGLEAVSFTDEKLEPALVAALKDSASSRRAVAACIVGRLGKDADKDQVRKLLEDKDAYVRLRAAQGLLAGKDKSAIPTLIRLLVEPSPSIAWQAEEMLHYVAGKSAPLVSVGKEVGEKAELCRSKWGLWWKEHGESCDLQAAGREGRRPQLLVFATESGNVWTAGCNSRPQNLSASWQLENAWHVEWLTSDRLLASTTDRISIRSVSGEVQWEAKLRIDKQRLTEANPVCQQRYPFKVYYSMAVCYQNLRGVDLKKEGCGDIWEFGMDGFNKALPFDTKRRNPNWNIVCRRLENGNWLAVDAQRQKLIEIDGREGTIVRSFNCEAINGWLEARLSLWPLSSGEYVFHYQRDDQVKQATPGGKVRWTYECGEGTNCQICCRLRDGNTLFAFDHAVVEASPEGRTQWLAFSELEHDNIACATRCLALVGFGFEHRPRDLDLAHMDVDYYIAALKCGSKPWRSLGLGGLTELGDKALAALPVVIENLALDGPDFYRDFLERHQQEAVPQLIKLADSQNPSKRRLAILALGELPGESEEIFQKILERLKDEDKAVRLTATRHIGYFPSQMKVAVPALLDIAKDVDNDIELRKTAVGSIVGQNARSAIPSMLELAAGRDFEMRCAGIRCLGAIGVADSDVVILLSEALEDDRISIERAAATAIRRIGPGAAGAIPALIRACAGIQDRELDSHSKNSLAQEVAQALMVMKEKSEPAVPELLKLAADSKLDLLARSKSIEAISSIGVAARPHVERMRKVLPEIDREPLRKMLRDVIEAIDR